MTRSVTFASGQTSATVDVPILEDSIIESAETFTASLTTSESNVVIGEDTATVTILDNDRKYCLNVYSLSKLLHLLAECPVLPPIPNGSVMVNNRSTGGTAVYSCDAGYTLVGAPERMCMSNSMWSGTEPSCELAEGKTRAYF